MAIDNQYPWWDDRQILTSEMNANCINFDLFRTPKSIYSFFDSNMQGCEEYKRKISVAVWSAINRNTRNHFLVIGESGCGKTELFRVLKTAYPNVTIFDSSNSSPKSYRGNNTLSDAFQCIDTTKPSFVVFDEFDKCLNKGNNGDLGFQMQSECLKFLEADSPIFVGDDKNLRQVDVSKTNLIFIGAFSSIKKNRKSCLGFGASITESKDAPITRNDIIENSSLTNEFIGRLNGGIIEIPAMTNERALQVITDPRYSPARHLSNQYGISIKISSEKAVELANNVNKYGMRQVYSTLNELISESLFENPDTTTVSI